MLVGPITSTSRSTSRSLHVRCNKYFHLIAMFLAIVQSIALGKPPPFSLLLGVDSVAKHVR